MLVDLFTSIGLSGVEWELVEGELYRIDRNIQLQVEPVTAEDRTANLSRWLADARLPDEAKAAMAGLSNSVRAASVSIREMGEASCRARVCSSVCREGGPGVLKKKMAKQRE